MRVLLRLLFVAICFAGTGFVMPHGSGAGGGGGSNPVFTPTALYYMSASGSDSNSGTSSGSPWATTHHAVNCGDVILAAPGSYNGFATWGVVSNCPSTTAGTTGSGGVMAAVLLCNGTHGSCEINCATATCPAGTVGSGGRSGNAACMNIDQDYWAIEGWDCNGNAGTGTGKRGFQISACLTTTTILHHVAFINDIVVNAAQGYDTDDCGYPSNNVVPGNGVDYFVVAGSIAQNANRDPICLGALDFVGSANSDTNSGTHSGFIGNFGIANSNNVSGGCTASDGEFMMDDTLDGHGYANQIYNSNNMGWDSSWVGLQIFMQSFNSSAPTVYNANNTLYANMQCTPFSPGTSGDISLQLQSAYPWTIDSYSNIVQTDVNSNGTMQHGSTCATASTVHAYAMQTSFNGGTGPTVTTGGAGVLANWFKGQASSCDSTCDSGDNVVKFGTGSALGTNTYTNPAFVNTSDLLTNWVGVPNCTGDLTTTQCMGWNYATQTATAATPIADLTPTASGTTGVGYQPPGACAADAKYPAWINYINFLYVSGGTIYEGSGLTNKPCNV